MLCDVLKLQSHTIQFIHTHENHEYCESVSECEQNAIPKLYLCNKLLNVECNVTWGFRSESPNITLRH